MLYWNLKFKSIQRVHVTQLSAYQSGLLWHVDAAAATGKTKSKSKETPCHTGVRPRVVFPARGQMSKVERWQVTSNKQSTTNNDDERKGPKPTRGERNKPIKITGNCIQSSCTWSFEMAHQVTLKFLDNAALLKHVLMTWSDQESWFIITYPTPH